MYKTKLFFPLFIAVLFILGTNGKAQTSITPKEQPVKVMIMEDVLFSGIEASTEAELIDKKIDRVDAIINDPSQKEAGADAENARKAALLEIKNKLTAQKNKLTSPAKPN